jgi:mRNA-degrading endonuclease YafQ of YafQ-DinJ toxin-antitoxin module
MNEKIDRKLMQQALEALIKAHPYSNSNKDLDGHSEAIAALGERLAQPEQESLAWLYPEGLAALKAGKCWTAYGTKQDKDNNIPIYTTPPEQERREWQGLTEKEVKKLADTHLVYQVETPEMSGVFDLIRAVSEKLEEKND